MAGIGFRLQKLLSGESYTDLVKAYLYSAVISTGPMLMVILALVSIKLAVTSWLSVEDGTFFMGMIIYVYAFSMIGVAPFLYIITRYLADRYYLKQMDAFTPTFITSLEIIFLLQIAFAAPFIWGLPLVTSAKWVLLTLYLFVSGIWIAMIFLSAAQNYLWIVGAYCLGAAASMGFGFVLGRKHAMEGFLAGYCIGQGLTFFFLTVRVFLEFGYQKLHDFGFLFYAKRYPYLVLVGIFYYIGIWADKFCFWFSPKGQSIVGKLFVFMDYDTPMFLAFLSIVPSMAFFLIRMETSFVRYYQAYYQSIRDRKGLSVINARKNAIIDNLTDHYQKFVVFQGILSGLIIIFIYQIAEAFYLNPLQIGIFRVGILGAFLQMGFLMILNILFYFDFQKEAFFLTLLFCLCNSIFTIITIHIGLPAYGFGFAGACFTVLFFGFLILDSKLKNLDYWTFMRQPILIPKFKLETEWAEAGKKVLANHNNNHFR